MGSLLHNLLALSARGLATVGGMLALSGAIPAAHAAQAENTYMAGPEVQIEQPLPGDLIAAAGRLTIGHAIAGDTLLGAGSMEINAPLGDDLRAAGGIVHLDSRVAGEALIAGWSVTVGKEAEIGRQAWLAGSDVAVAGRLHGPLKAYGRRITVSGRVEGPVVLSGERIEILDTARIGSDLRYASANEIVIHPNARISGTVTRMSGALGVPKQKLTVPGLPALRPLLLLGLLVAAMVLYWLFPRFTVTSSRALGATPVKSLGLGAGIFFSAPPIILLLVITIIGIPIALALAAIYVVAILAGYLVSAFFLGERAVRLLRDADPTTRWRLLSVALALIVLELVRHIPYAGGVIALLAVILGLGAMVLQAFTHYADRT